MFAKEWKGQWMERILHLDITDSTNEVLKKLAEDGAREGQVVIADEQLAGKGRRGRKFESPKGKGIYFSYLLRPKKMTPELSTLTARTAVAIQRAIYKACGIQTGIKWVNDLVLHQKKVCGILTEMSMEAGEIRYVIIGIGINVNEEEKDFPEELRKIATSFSIEMGKTFSRGKLIGEMVKELDQMCSGFLTQKETYLEEYRKFCITTGKEVCVISGESKRRAYALCVNEDYSLEVEYEDGNRESLNAGEVSVRGIEGYI